MNAYDLCLEIIVVGVRGAGKTLVTTHFVLEALRRAWALKHLRELKGANIYPKQKVNIWTNYPVKALWHPSFSKKPLPLQSQIFDLDKLVVWDKQFHDGIIFFDEIDQVADRQDWFSQVSKFLTAGIQVIRHRNLSLIMTIQSINWLNARIQWQADIIIKCRDLAFTPWGRENQLSQGEVISTSWIDKSGIMTGYSFEETEKVYPMQFYGKRYWNAYPTTHEFDVLELKSKRRVKTAEVLIDASGVDEIDEINRKAINDAVMYYVFSNQSKVRSFEFWGKATQFGFEGNIGRYNRYIASLNAKKHGTGDQAYLNFEDVQVNV
jgi:hypothetical protein